MSSQVGSQRNVKFSVACTESQAKSHCGHFAHSGGARVDGGVLQDAACRGEMVRARPHSLSWFCGGDRLDRRGAIGRFDGQSADPNSVMVAADSTLDVDSPGRLDLFRNHVRFVHRGHVDQAEYATARLRADGRPFHHQRSDDIWHVAGGARPVQRQTPRKRAMQGELFSVELTLEQ